MDWVNGHAVCITGGASGLGRAIVSHALAGGARVGVLDRNPERLATLSDLGDDVVTVVGDVTSLEDNRRLVQDTVARFGRLDAFIANAGIWDYRTSLGDLPDEQIASAFDEVLGVNLKGYLLGAKAAAPALRADGGGALVFTLSNAAFYPGGGGPLYTASKHGGVGLVRQLAYELAPDIRVNAVAPGGMATDLRGPAALRQEDTSISAALPMGELMRTMLPLAIEPTPDDYVGPYLLLASQTAGRAMTGSIINIDCGVGVRA